MKNWQFVKLNNTKARIDSHTYSFNEVKELANVGAIVPDGFIVVDLDDANEAEKMYDICKANGIKTITFKTARGRHFWFRLPANNPDFCRQKIAQRTVCGLTIDTRVGGKGYVVLRLNGELRRAEALNTSNDFDTVDVIPAFLTPDYRNNAPELVDLVEGSRVSTLRNHYCTLASFKQINEAKGQSYMTTDEIVKTMYIINGYIIADPLTHNEMFYQVTSQDTLPNLPQNELKTASFAPEKEITPPPAENAKNTANNAPFTVDDHARNIIRDMDLIVHNNILYKYNNNHYESVSGQFNTVIKHIALANPTFSNKKINDIRQRVEWLATINDDQVDRNNDYINFMNGTLNLSSCCFEAKTEKRICFDYIPRSLNLNLKNENFDQYMLELFSDQATIDFIYEIFGYSLLKNLDAQKFFVFYGPPGTGKSALLKMWMAAIGSNNVSTTSITSIITNRFSLETMKDKLLNAVTEADHSAMVKNTDLLKQLACGEEMNIERKFAGIQKCNLYATQIHCLNYPIVTNDEALNDRIICVPFMNRFRDTKKQLAEHMLIESLGGEKAYDYLMLQAVRGLIRFLKRGGRFDIPATVAAATSKFKGGAESIETFLEEADINEKNISNYGYKDLATLYQAYCNDIGIVPLSKPKFHQELVHVLPVKVRKYNDERGRRYVTNEA